MNTDKRLEMYIEQYHFELEQKEKIFSRLALILVVLIACIGAVSATLPKYSALLSTPYIRTLTIILTIILPLSLIGIIFHIARFLSAKNDELVPSSNEMEAYYNQLEHYNSSNTSLNEDYVNIKFSSFLLKSYTAAASTTYDNNCFKLKCLNRCYELLIIFVLSTLILCSAPIYLNQEAKGDQKMAENTQPLPPEPTPPSNRIIRSDNSIVPQKPQQNVTIDIKVDNNPQKN